MEYSYQQQRPYLVEGNYFAEPVVKIKGAWGGIGSANRVNFTVTPGIQMVQNLSLDHNPPVRGEAVTATFKIRNASDHTISFYRLLAGSRGPDCYDLECTRNMDFPVTGSPITLQAGEEYTYSQISIFNQSGNGFLAVPVMEVMPGWWETVPGAGYTRFTVVEGGKLQVIEPLSLSSTAPGTGTLVTARFKVQNVGVLPLHIEQLTAGCRRGSNWNGEWADFPNVFNIDLAPGAEYTYLQSRSFDITGTYFAEPVVKINGVWGGISGANRVVFDVQTR
jgi:hypothetical protein